MKRFKILTFIGLFLLVIGLQAKTVVDKTVGQFDYYTLALSWQPAFCEIQPKNPGCSSQSKKSFAATHFVLHGLWPNVKKDRYHTYGYCQVSSDIIQNDKQGQWCHTPPLKLSNRVRKSLNQFMPGTISCLQRHEWYKHGTCSGLSENDYFVLSNQLIELFTQTQFSRYIAQQVGQSVKRKEVLKTFEQEFGKKNRRYLALKCRKHKGKSLLTEIQIQLRKDLSVLNHFDLLFPSDKLKVRGTCPRQFKIDEMGID